MSLLSTVFLRSSLKRMVVRPNRAGGPSASGSSGFRQGGVAALPDRSSRPGRPRHQTPAHLIALIRQLRVTYGLPAWALGRALGVPAPR